ncbi:extracellular metalloprotease [Plectosphaerella plurivora]|uniref:Extracellular metalloprotease n=1 Tax=Plectosphaerella plurivora TaxID=936078 RepID=A0A9P8V8R1_9PEZI|nr:extracellular metalloprotease [Plectosphaerella plurivora]
MVSTFWTRVVPACIAAMASGVNAQQIRRCANEAPTMEQMAQAANLSRFDGLDGINARSDIPTPISIPTYVHILASSETVAGGWLSDADIKRQMDVLNADFGAHNISFNVLETTRTINNAWTTDADGTNMRRQLRRGGYDALNLYFMRYVSGYLGYCSLPSERGATNFVGDGCAILAASIPGGSAVPYNEGRTATHEIGHWLNLFHTFDGGCSCVGDMIHDTPAESRDHYGCPIGLDSCPDRPGLDPIHNYMAYTDDACMNEFTLGQAFRMRSAWYNLRLNK